MPTLAQVLNRSRQQRGTLSTVGGVVTEDGRVKLRSGALIHARPIGAAMPSPGTYVIVLRTESGANRMLYAVGGKDADLSKITKTLDEHATLQKELQAKDAELQKQLDAANVDLGKIHTTLGQQADLHTKLQAKDAELQQGIDGVKNEITDINGELNAHDEALKALKATDADLQQQINAANTKITALEKWATRVTDKTPYATAAGNAIIPTKGKKFATRDVVFIDPNRFAPGGSRVRCLITMGDPSDEADAANVKAYQIGVGSNNPVPREKGFTLQVSNIHGNKFTENLRVEWFAMQQSQDKPQYYDADDEED